MYYKEYFDNKTLFTLENPKLKKGMKENFHSIGLSLAPSESASSKELKINTCAYASKGCIKSCIFTSGRGKMKNVSSSRINRTRYLFTDKENFLKKVIQEIFKQEQKAIKEKLTLCVRLNVYSDIPWELKAYGQIPQAFPNIIFYDYTKSFKRMKKYLRGDFPCNYHLTFSRSETNEKECVEVLKLGGTVAVPFAEKLPSKYLNSPVIDGDETDLRFLDPVGHIIGLKVKGDGKKDASGFIIQNTNEGSK